MQQLLDIFLFCGGFGFIWISGSALLGFIGTGSDDGGGADDGGGDLGNADGSDGGDLGGVDADAGVADTDAGGDLGSIEGATANSFRSGLVLRRKRLSPVMLTLKLLSPSTITTFMFFFGLAGYLTLHTWPVIGVFALIPAIAFGIIGYRALSAFSGLLIKKMNVSTSHTEDSMIGREAEVTVPIDPGRLGEVTYTAGNVRHTAPARGVDPTGKFPKGSRVMLCSLKEGIFSVETWGLDEAWGEVPLSTREKLPDNH